MEKPVHHQQQQQVAALKCPRCDSSNTKFCYYNNYSLSQPRHFCKACKRYWTRGGTLRNVPVGGGCRKNKQHRLKRPSSSTTINAASSQPQPPHQIDAASSNPNLFYGLAAPSYSNPCDVVNNLPFSSSRFISSSRIPSSSSGLFDLIQPQMNALGLGFSSGVVMSRDNGFIRNNNNGFTSNSNNDDNNTIFPSYSSIFSSCSSSSASTPTTSPVMMPNNSSVLGSSMMMMMQQQQQQQKVMNNNNNNNGGKDDGPGGRNIISFHEGLVEVAPQMGISGDDDDDVHGGVVVGASKGVKVELGQNRLLEFWNTNNNNGTDFQNQQIEQHVNVMSMSHPPDPDPNSNSNSNSLYWNSRTTAAAAAALGGSNWNDQPNNIGPSLTSLI